MTTDFSTIYNQTADKVATLKAEIAHLEKQVKSLGQDYQSQIEHVKDQANSAAQTTEVSAVDYVSNIRLDQSQINAQSMLAVFKQMLKI